MLYPEVQGTDPFWMASARSLFLGISLYLFETPSLPKTIGEVLRQGMASDDEGFGHHWKRIIEGRNSGRFPLSDQCVRALYDVIDLAPVTASSIRKTFTSRLDLWLNPMLDTATSASDFDLRDLRRRPMSRRSGLCEEGICVSCFALPIREDTDKVALRTLATDVVPANIIAALVPKAASCACLRTHSSRRRSTSKE
jgi:hypothetical protein